MGNHHTGWATTFLFASLAVLASAGNSFAGPPTKEIMQQAPSPCEWYRAHEWDLALWGTFAFAANTGFHERPRVGGEFADRFPLDDTKEAFSVPLGPYHRDRFLDRDDAWGGGVDLKYFFSKYWALGVEGFVVNANDNAGGAGIGTATVRYPIGCSRFAPYGWAGFGVTGGGSHSNYIFFKDERNQFEHEFVRARTQELNKHYEATGQFGGGIEVRVTPRIGVMTDFAWNLLSGPDNNFGMWRFGATLSY